MNLFLSRSDRLGDLLVTLPAWQLVRDAFPSAKITVHVNSLWAPLVKRLQWIDACVTDADDQDSLFRKTHFQGSVLYNYQSNLAWTAFRTGVPYRVGNWSKVSSFFLLNQGIRQNRSASTRHEGILGAELSEHLIRKLGGTVPSYGLRSVDYVGRPDLKSKARNWLVSQGYREDRPLVVFHPGMGGSARRVPVGQMIQWMAQANQRGWAVLVTGGPADALVLAEVRSQANGMGLGAPWMVYDSLQMPADHDLASVEFLVALFENAAAVVAHSTGPLHLAAWAGIPTVGLYSPVGVQHSRRWSPFLAVQKSKILAPKVECPERFRCSGAKCEYFDCMTRHEVLDLIPALEEVLS